MLSVGKWHIWDLLRDIYISMFNGTSTPKGSYSAKTGAKLPYESKQSPPEKNVMVK